MIDVAEARRLAEKRLRTRMGQWAGEQAVLAEADGALGVRPAEAEVGSPAFELGLKPPTEKEVMGDLAGAEAWVRSWRAAATDHSLDLDWQSRAWKSVGRQDVPVRARFPTPEDVAVFVGGSAERDWRRLSARVREIRQRWPQTTAHSTGPSVDGDPATGDAETTAGQDRVAAAGVVADRGAGNPSGFTASAGEFTAVVRSLAKRLLDLGDDEFAQVIDVVSWLAENPLGTMRPRQLPIRGVDSKWFGTHRGLVRALLSLAGAPGGLDILDAEANVRLRLLDPAMAFGPLRDLAAPVDQLARLNLQPRTVLIVENLESVLALPDRPGTVAIHGSGYTVGVVARLRWAASARVAYWGDLDSHGFAILNRLRAHLPAVESLLMDEDTLLAHRDLWVREPTPHRGSLLGLTGSEQRALDRLRSEGDVRLEQERIPWDAALAAVDAALR
ncbi:MULTISPECIES: Wadjet anti-phage system protein JetD domain-containing protein [Brevibacterium]|uniref:Wadjet anti-phage system protein JetD domain-containing protein n=1 Tax=Brevibacterium TaxID=1696 RepID=UPI0031D23B2D